MRTEEAIGRQFIDQLQPHLNHLSFSLKCDREALLSVTQGARACQIYFFHYPREGAEYCFTFFSEGASTQPAGRTRDSKEAEQALIQWLIHSVTREELYRQFPFVDQEERSLLAIQKPLQDALLQLGSALKPAILKGPSLWVYQQDRSCNLRELKNKTTCTFRVVSTELGTATVDDPALLAPAICRWIEQRSSTKEMQEAHSFFVADDCAQDYEAGTLAASHWRSWLAETDAHTKSLYGPLLQALSKYRAAPQFYLYTSHFHLCFSRCPDYPFSTRGLPVVTPLWGPEYPGSSQDAVSWYRIDRGFRALMYPREKHPLNDLRGGPEDIAARVEELLTPEVHTTHYGDNMEPVRKEIDEALASMGSLLRVEYEYRDPPWIRHSISWQGRSCEVSLLGDEYSVNFSNQKNKHDRFSTLASMLTAVRSWLEA